MCYIRFTKKKLNMKKNYVLAIILLSSNILAFKAQTLDVNSTSTCNFETSSINNSSVVAQSFTNGISGSLTSVIVGIQSPYCTETSVVNGTATIYAGTCAGTVLTNESFTFPADNDFSMREITFSTPATMIAGQVYTLELMVTPNQLCTIGRRPYMASLGWRVVTDGIDINNCSYSSYAGGMSYFNCTERSWDLTIQTYISAALSVNDFTANNVIKIYPNPSNDFIKISGLKKSEKYIIYNLLGNAISNGIISNNEKVNIQNMSDGMYFFKFENGNTIKFIKK